MAVTLFVVAATVARPAAAQQSGDWPRLSLRPVTSGFASPVHAIQVPGDPDTLLVVEQEGIVRPLSLRGLGVSRTPFLDIRERVLSEASEQGLLSLAFPADFQASRVFYAAYTAGSGPGELRVSRFRMVPGSTTEADAASEQIILSITKPATNHNGGHILFGPDGLLYLGVGDGGSAGDPAGNAQDPARQLGKILRADVAEEDVRWDVYALGVRNPWRLAFDPLLGDLYIADVGQGRVEEVSVLPAGTPPGANLGWNRLEGSRCYPGGASCDATGTVLPVAEYDHSLGCSVTGGVVSRGGLVPGLEGVYLYGDFCSGRIWGLRRVDSRWESRQLLQTALPIVSFASMADGRIFVVSLDGSLHELVAGDALQPRATVPLIARN